MIPQGLNTENIVIKTQPSVNHKMKLADSFVAGKCDGAEAMKQVVYKILETERYRHVIYSRNYGIELNDLFGQPAKSVVLTLPGRIKEALTQDDRIISVDGFSFDISKKRTVAVSFTVHTVFGDMKASKEVPI